LKKQLINSKYFKDNQLDMKLMINYVIILKNAYELFSSRFSQFRQLDSTLEFLIYPHNIKIDKLELSFFEWLSIENLEMELIEFQGSNIWRNKFINLNNELENNHSKIGRNIKSENLILNEWKSLPNSFASMKKLALSL